MRRLISLAAAGIALSLTDVAAQAQSLGASFEAVRHSYNEARVVDFGGSRALELRSVDYAGVRWTAVDFVFDPSGHLQRMSMTTTSAPYETIMRLAEMQLAAPSPPQTLATSAEDASSDMQIRVCQRDDGQITLTYEPLAAFS